jgi:O-antigen ligase
MVEYLQYVYGPLALLTLALLFWRPVAGIALLVSIFPMDPWGPRLPVPGVNTETILIGVALAVTVLRFGARFPPLRYSAPIVAFITVMFVAFAVSIPWALNMQGVDGVPAVWVIFKTWKSISFTALLFFSVYWWCRTPEDRARVLQGLCIGLFLSSVAGILDFAIDINPFGIEGRASGFVADPNALAESIGSMMFVPLFLIMRGREFSAPWRTFAAGSYALAAVVIVISLSRGNWIAFLAAHFVFLLLVNRALLVGGIVAFALVLTIGFPLLPEAVRERIEVTTTTGKVVYQTPLALNLDSSTASRIVFARIGLDMFMRSPIWGHGLNAFNFRTPEFGAKYGILIQKDPHNIAVKMAADAGLIGLAVLASIIWAVFRCGRRLWRSESDEYLLGAVLLATATHLLVANLSANAFLYVSQISSQFWVLYALSARAYVERGATAAAPVAQPVLAGRWRRFAQRTPVAVSQP